MNEIVKNIKTSFKNVQHPSQFNIKSVCESLTSEGYSCFSGFLPEKLLMSLHEEAVQFDAENLLKTAGIGRGEDHAMQFHIRRDKIKWFDANSTAQCELQEYLEALRLKINENLMLGLFAIESHYAIYDNEDFYKLHLDSFVGQKNRIISMVIYLNKDWQVEDGGLLNIYKHIKCHDPIATIIPAWGTIVVFLSEQTPHEVTIVNKKRYSIASWFRCNPSNHLI